MLQKSRNPKSRVACRAPRQGWFLGSPFAVTWAAGSSAAHGSGHCTSPVGRIVPCSPCTSGLPPERLTQRAGRGEEPPRQFVFLPAIAGRHAVVVRRIRQPALSGPWIRPIIVGTAVAREAGGGLGAVLRPAARLLSLPLLADSQTKPHHQQRPGHSLHDVVPPPSWHLSQGLTHRSARQGLSDGDPSSPFASGSAVVKWPAALSDSKCRRTSQPPPSAR